jgi:hypothetical protein
VLQASELIVGLAAAAMATNTQAKHDQLVKLDRVFEDFFYDTVHMENTENLESELQKLFRVRVYDRVEKYRSLGFRFCNI